jgi:hypothetical protein
MVDTWVRMMDRIEDNQYILNSSNCLGVRLERVPTRIFSKGGEVVFVQFNRTLKLTREWDITTLALRYIRGTR